MHVQRRCFGERENDFSLYLACVASVSARVRRERWDESKKKGMTGEEEGKEGTTRNSAATA